MELPKTPSTEYKIGDRVFVRNQVLRDNRPHLAYIKNIRILAEWEVKEQRGYIGAQYFVSIPYMQYLGELFYQHQGYRHHDCKEVYMVTDDDVLGYDYEEAQERLNESRLR